MYNALTTASGNEKKTRTWEGTDDLTALITNLNESLPLASRMTYAYDNLDLPQTASYFATMAHHQQPGPRPQKLLPLPRQRQHRRMDDFAVGRGSHLWPQLGVKLRQHQLFQRRDVHHQHPEFLSRRGHPDQTRQPALRFVFRLDRFQQMYLRRLRTLMDTILMPPWTPTNYSSNPKSASTENLIESVEHSFRPTRRWITRSGGRPGATPT